MKKSTILDKKVKIESLSHIQNQWKISISCNKKTYHIMKSQDRELILYQKLKVIKKSLLSLLKVKKNRIRIKEKKNLLLYKKPL